MEQLTAILAAHLQSNHHIESVENLIQWQETRPEFEGDLTLVVFPFLKVIKKSPEQLGQEFGQLFLDHAPSVLAFNVVKGFLNLTIASEEFVHALQQLSFSDLPKTGKRLWWSIVRPIPTSRSTWATFEIICLDFLLPTYISPSVVMLLKCR